MHFWEIIAKATALLILLWIFFGVFYYAASAYLGIIDSEQVFEKCKFLGYLYFILFSVTSIEIISIFLYIIGTSIKYIINFIWNIY